MRSKALLFTSAVLCASNVPANAISWGAQMNCASDYYAYCSMHTAGSAECHACMRANRPRLSNSCVSALIDDGVIPKADVAQQKAKIEVATAKAKPAARLTVMPVANPVAKAPSANFAAVRPTPKSASSVAIAVLSAHPESLPREPEPLTTPPQHPVEAALAIDQQTFEAFKNRAPYFLATAELEAKFEETAANASPQPPLAPR